MPWYDYKCNHCGYEEKDVRRKITEDVSQMKCPKCQKQMKQIIVNTFRSFELKGKWFKNGY